MHKLLVFDLDGTLASVGKSMANADVEKLLELEQQGYTIVICSGKPTYYLCGFARQLGLQAPILIGENGATFQFGVELPPTRYEVHPYSERARAQLDMMRALIDRECGDKVWYQPNEVGLTPFPKDEKTFEVIQKLMNERVGLLSEILVYRHIDSFDLTPKNINKQNGLAYLSELTGFECKDMVAVGDGVNDIPMFEYADVAIGIGGEITESVDFIFATISEALNFILEKTI